MDCDCFLHRNLGREHRPLYRGVHTAQEHFNKWFPDSLDRYTPQEDTGYMPSTYRSNISWRSKEQHANAKRKAKERKESVSKIVQDLFDQLPNLLDGK